jgi:hypothetical protein
MIPMEVVEHRDQLYMMRCQLRATAFMTQLTAFLSGRPHQMAPIDEVQGWADPPMARGDLVRFVRRWPDRFRVLSVPVYAIQLCSEPQD